MGNLIITTKLGDLTAQPELTRQKRQPVLQPGWRHHFRLWLVGRCSRNGVSDLNDHLLRDINITRYDALREAAKPFWR